MGYTCASLFRLLHVQISSDLGVSNFVGFFLNKIKIFYTIVSFFFHIIMFNELLFPQCLESVLQLVLSDQRERKRKFPFSPVSKVLCLL